MNPRTTRYTIPALAALAALAFGCSKDDKKSEDTAEPQAQNTPSTAPEEKSTLLAVGTPAPDFTSEAHEGTVVTMSALKGEPAVLFFYPKDETPGCIIENEEFRDRLEDFNQLGVDVIGISADSLESHRQFADKRSLTFPLLADPDAEIATKYGVPVKNGYFARVTYVIGPDGKIAHVYPKVNPKGHAEEVLAVVKPMIGTGQGTDEAGGDEGDEGQEGNP